MHVTAKLRELRKRAKMSMDAAAKALGFKGPSSYQRYENPDLFKDEFLPLDVARKLAPAFAERGVPVYETLALAGLPASSDLAADPNAVRVPLETLRVVVQGLAEYRVEEDLALSPAEESDMVASFCRWFSQEVAAGRQDEPLTVERTKSLLRLLDIRRLH